MKVVVLFNLREGFDVAAYEDWARTTDMPTVRGLGSVSGFEMFRCCMQPPHLAPCCLMFRTRTFGLSMGLQMLSSPIWVHGARGDNRRVPALEGNDKDDLA